MTGEPAVRAVLAATLLDGTGRLGGGKLPDFDVDLSNTVRLFATPSDRGAGVGHLVDCRRAPGRRTLTIHVHSNSPSAHDLVQIVEAGDGPELSLLLADTGNRPGAPRSRPRLVGLVADYLAGFDGSELRIISRGGLRIADTAAQRQLATRAATTARLLAPFASRPAVDLAPIPQPWRR